MKKAIIEIISRFICMYCGKENEEYCDNYIEGEKVSCRYCKKISKITFEEL